jgi:hypothetical protein
VIDEFGRRKAVNTYIAEHYSATELDFMEEGVKVIRDAFVTNAILDFIGKWDFKVSARIEDCEDWNLLVDYAEFVRGEYAKGNKSITAVEEVTLWGSWIMKSNGITEEQLADCLRVAAKLDEVVFYNSDEKLTNRI